MQTILTGFATMKIIQARSGFPSLDGRAGGGNQASVLAEDENLSILELKVA
jgi:hypothetical protein